MEPKTFVAQVFPDGEFAVLRGDDVLQESDYDIAAGFAILWMLLWEKRAHELKRIIRADKRTIPAFSHLGSPEPSVFQQPTHRVVESYRSLNLKWCSEFSTIPEGALAVFETCLPCGRHNMAVLDGYQKLYQLLVDWDVKLRDAETIFERAHGCISSQPGIGKTLFLSYVLVCRLIDGKPCVFQMKSHDSLYLFDKTGVTQIDKRNVENSKASYLKDKNTWILVDEEPWKNLFQPYPPRAMIIQAASPKRQKFRGSKDLNTITFYFDVWSWNEVACSLAPKTYTKAEDFWLLWCYYHRYGGIARDICKAIAAGLEKSLNIAEREMRALAQEVARDTRHFPRDFFTGPDLTHRIIVTRPFPDTDLAPFSIAKRSVSRNHQTGIRTMYLMQLVYEQCTMAYQKRALEIYQLLKMDTDASTYQGWIFERQIHAYFARGPASKVARALTPNTPSISLPVTLPGVTQFENVQELGRLLRAPGSNVSINVAMMGKYLVPIPKNFPAVDSLIMTGDATGFRLFLLQVTVGEQHPIPIEPIGLRQLVDNLPKGFNRAQKTEINFVFLVPAEIEPAYRTQNLLKSGKPYPSGALEPWMKSMRQFVIGFTDEELFHPNDDDYSGPSNPKRRRV